MSELIEISNITVFQPYCENSSFRFCSSPFCTIKFLLFFSECVPPTPNSPPSQNPTPHHPNPFLQRRYQRNRAHISWVMNTNTRELLPHEMTSHSYIINPPPRANQINKKFPHKEPNKAESESPRHWFSRE